MPVLDLVYVTIYLAVRIFPMAISVALRHAQGCMQAGLTPTALAVGKELIVGIVLKTHPDVPPECALGFLFKPGDVLVFLAQGILFLRGHSLILAAEVRGARSLRRHRPLPARWPAYGSLLPRTRDVPGYTVASCSWCQ